MTFEEYLSQIGYDPQTGKDPHGRSINQIVHDIKGYGADLATQEERASVRDGASRWQSQNRPVTTPDMNGMGSDGMQRTPTNTPSSGPGAWQGGLTDQHLGLLAQMGQQPEQEAPQYDYWQQPESQVQQVGIQTPDYGQPQMRDPMEFAQKAANPMSIQYNQNVSNMNNAAKDWRPQLEGLLSSMKGNLL